MRYTLPNPDLEILQNDILVVDKEGYFKIPPMVFGDSARLVFDTSKGKGVYFIDLETPRDSGFTSFYGGTVFIRLGMDSMITLKETASYEFAFAGPGITREETIVNGGVMHRNISASLFLKCSKEDLMRKL